MSDKNQNWLDKNTFHHGEFWDILKLVEEKEKSAENLSCIPTLNEEKTIGKEVLILRSELMDRYPLIDEFAVITTARRTRLSRWLVLEPTPILPPTSFLKSETNAAKGKTSGKRFTN